LSRFDGFRASVGAGIMEGTTNRASLVVFSPPSPRPASELSLPNFSQSCKIAEFYELTDEINLLDEVSIITRQSNICDLARFINVEEGVHSQPIDM